MFIEEKLRIVPSISSKRETRENVLTTFPTEGKVWCKRGGRGLTTYRYTAALRSGPVWSVIAELWRVKAVPALH